MSQVVQMNLVVSFKYSCYHIRRLTSFSFAEQYHQVYHRNDRSTTNTNPMKNLLRIALAAALVTIPATAFQQPILHVSNLHRNSRDSLTTLQATSTNEAYTKQSPFSLSTALFLAGLSFNAYTEPPPNSSRWEKGSSGLNVAFLSSSYTRSLYSGIVEVTPLKATDLPDEDDAAESVMTGGGIDATLLVSVVEGAWKEDVEMLEKEQFHNG
jgi:hypothetical protein